ncbi:ribonuclease Z [Halalkalibacillus halophilus]|uniref:ribonuclease Z n=1 Tax=Halalkalibacillus halophilus TaxID=392827 RepID=UPI000412360B|nr:ribonuclease Z [Halalkalibacillus halophilus]
MELTFLGTGSGVPSKQRNVSSIALSMLQDRNEVWLFDCGEATQHQILKTNIKPRKINKVLITHLHGDHIFGLPGFLSSRGFQDGTSPVQIIGPKAIKDFMEIALKVSETSLRYPISYKQVSEDKLLEDNHLILYGKSLKHGVDSFGYLIEEKDSPGHLIPEKLKNLGIKPGPSYQRIKDDGFLQLENGETIFREDVSGPPIKGKRIAILGDTRPTQEIINFVENVDVLVHEATFTKADEELAIAYNHSTTADAARIAKQANVKQLLLTHISSRYQWEDLMREQKMISEIFESVAFMNDLDTYTIK